jgi:general secretion pathway protein E/type IV pilus assembly protein PilB
MNSSAESSRALTDPGAAARLDEHGPRDPIDRMVQTRQLSLEDADAWRRHAAASPDAQTSDEAAVLRWLAEEYGLTFSDLTSVEPDRQLVTLFPARVLLKEELLPLRRVDGVVEVATSRLFATEGLDTLKTLTGLRLRPVLAPGEAIRREMKTRLGVGADTLDSLQEEASLQVIDESDDGNVDLDAAAEDASIIKFVNQVLGDAIALRATDIHLEPFEDELRIRYRIDGILQDVPVPASIKRFQPAIVSRVKILSHLDIAEKRLPQDGRIKVRLDRHEVDVRVSLIPMLHGEGVVMRLLKQDTALMRLRDLDMDERDLKVFGALLALPHGIVLVTGPTGSGKSTTLYSALGEINDSIRKIITIEDPVEYHMKGINQIQVSEKAGLTFARGLRSILRHDPDVVLIGEIRDAETAKIAVQASLTGHLVFSTLHTNDASGAPTRLVDMGVEPYLVASSIEGILAQRLVRVLCPHCKTEDPSPATVAFKKQIGIETDRPVYRAVACDRCRRTGFHGRRGIFELMSISEAIRELILTSRSAGALRDAARREGLRLLSEDGWRLVREGTTTVDEVLRVTKDAMNNIVMTGGAADGNGANGAGH